MTTLTRQETLIKEGKIELTRQLGFLDPTQPKFQIPMTMVGSGGIGSPTAMMLSKMGLPNLRLIDPDTIEVHNLPNQMFPIGSEGKHKVDMLSAVCKMFGSSEVRVAKKKIEEVPELLGGLVITGLDSMEARKAVWEKVRLNREVKYLIDARMGGLGFNIWALDPNDTKQIDIYDEHAMYSDEEGEETPCTERAIMYVAFVIAGVIGHTVHQYFNETPAPILQEYDMRGQQLTVVKV